LLSQSLGVVRGLVSVVVASDQGSDSIRAEQAKELVAKEEFRGTA